MNDSTAFSSGGKLLLKSFLSFFLIFLWISQPAVGAVDEPAGTEAWSDQEDRNPDSQAIVESGAPSPSAAEVRSVSRATGAVQAFERWLDQKTGFAVNIIASVLFWEFIGRQEVTVIVDGLSVDRETFDQLTGQVRRIQGAAAPRSSEWRRVFMQENLSVADQARLDAALDQVVQQLTGSMQTLGSQVSVGEANLMLTLPQGAVSPEAASLISEKLAQQFTASPLRSFTVAVSSDSQTAATVRAVRSGIPIVVAWLAVGALFFTLRMRFINIRAFWHAIRVTAGKYDDPADAGEVTHFQALNAALSATVGLGNIGGVAIAVGTGGPGATFWMIIAGLLGMSAKFAECTLGQKYREVRPDGRIMGGAMFYLSKGLAEMKLAPLGKLLGVLFAVLCVGASFGGGNAFQINQAISTVQTTFPGLDTPVARFVAGVLMAALVGVVIIGGIRRIASTAEKIVPLMCGVYVAACLYILFRHSSEIPAAVLLIVTEAFTPQAGYGGFLGVLILGFRRAAFSNEAGVGSAAIAHSAARTDYPVREGIVALLEPFIDTVVVCTMTAMVIVITGAYNTSDPTYAPFIFSNQGAALTSVAMKQEIIWFPYVLSVAVLLFAYSTMISWSYYGERCWSYLFGDRMSLAYKILFILCVVVGAMMNATNVLDLSDLMILGMAFPNILGVVLLSGKVRRDLDEYWGRLKSGDLDREAAAYREK